MLNRLDYKEKKFLSTIIGLWAGLSKGYCYFVVHQTKCIKLKKKRTQKDLEFQTQTFRFSPFIVEMTIKSDRTYGKTAVLKNVGMRHKNTS